MTSLRLLLKLSFLVFVFNFLFLFLSLKIKCLQLLPPIFSRLKLALWFIPTPKIASIFHRQITINFVVVKIVIIKEALSQSKFNLQSFFIGRSIKMRLLLRLILRQLRLLRRLILRQLRLLLRLIPPRIGLILPRAELQSSIEISVLSSVGGNSDLNKKK